jgi:hypothetical protein
MFFELVLISHCFAQMGNSRLNRLIRCFALEGRSVWLERSSGSPGPLRDVNSSCIPRCGAPDNLQRRGWHLAPVCHLCSQDRETCAHIFLSCRYTQQVCATVRGRLGLSSTTPSADLSSWWRSARKSISKQDRKTFDAGVILVTWRNAMLEFSTTRPFRRRTYVQQWKMSGPLGVQQGCCVHCKPEATWWRESNIKPVVVARCSVVHTCFSVWQAASSVAWICSLHLCNLFLVTFFPYLNKLRLASASPAKKKT